jgi:hypothetical protein
MIMDKLNVEYMKAKEILLEYGSVKKAVDNYKLAN